MRILQVCPRFSPQMGGVETHVLKLSEHLIDRGHHVAVHTADAGADDVRRKQRDRVEVRRHHGFAPGGAYHFAPGIAPAIRRAEADIVHAHNYHAFPLLLAAMGVSDERFVVTPHYHGESPKAIRDRLLDAYRPLGQWAVRRADAVIAVGEWEGDRLRDAFGVDVSVIPNGIDLDRFRLADPEEREHPYLLCVGRLEAYKGVQHAVRALAHLPDYELLVAGEGPYRSALAGTAAEADVSQRVTFLGRVPDERLASLYAGATVYVALSSIEAFGLTVGEALAAGTPCVVLEASGLADWTDYAGCLGVVECDPETVAEAIAAAADREVDVSALPGWDEVTGRVEAVYDRVLEREGTG